MPSMSRSAPVARAMPPTAWAAGPDGTADLGSLIRDQTYDAAPRSRSVALRFTY